MTTLHATPYGIYEGFSGFYFESLEDYEAKYDAAEEKYGCKEYEIQFIEGGDNTLKLFDAMKVNQGNLDDYFEYCDKLDDINMIAMDYLTGCSGYSFTDALDKQDDVQIFEGTAVEYAAELMEDCYFSSDTPAIFRNYFDYDSFARDLEIEGNIYCLRIDGQDYVITNANDV